MFLKTLLLVSIIVAATFSCCLSVELTLLIPGNEFNANDKDKRNKYDDNGIEINCEQQGGLEVANMHQHQQQLQQNIHKHYTTQHEEQQQQQQKQKEQIEGMLEEQRLKQVKELVLQQFNGQLRLELQKEHQQQQQQQQQQQFDPFYFANLRWLQQHEKEQQQQHHQQQRVEHYIGDSNDVDADDDGDDDKNNNNTNSNGNKNKGNYGKNKRLIQQSNISNTGNPKSLNMYYNGQSHNSASNNNNYNYNNHKEQQHHHHHQQQQQQQPESPQQQFTQHQQQQQQQQQQQHFDVDPQDARNDFLLQLSDLNEAVKSVGTKRRSAKVSQNKNNSNYTKNNVNFNNDVANNYNDAVIQVKNNNGEEDENGNGNADNYKVANAESFIKYNPRRTNINAMQMATDYAVTESSEANANHRDVVQDSSSFKGFNNDGNGEFDDDDSVDTDGNDDDELAMNLLYGIQNVRRKRQHSGRSSTHSLPATTSITYQSLCLTKRVNIPLETEAYKYRPISYIEVTCAHNYAQPHLVNHDSNKNKVCSSVGFSCIQLNRTIHLIRRSKRSPDECWEPEMRIVPSGCECMWPRHSYGDIGAYHHERPRKRFNQFAKLLHPLASPLPQITDYKHGLGYRQLQLQGSEPEDSTDESPNIDFDSFAIN